MAEKSDKVSMNDSRIDELKLLMESFNLATTKLEDSYSVIQEEARKLREEVEEKNRRLSALSNLLEGVLMNSGSAIIAIDKNGTILTMNKESEKMASSFGHEKFLSMLGSFVEPGLYEHEPERGVYLKISLGELNAEGISGTVYVIDDISDLKALEKEKHRDEKLMLMGEMAANIAHEIRNPLGGIELFASLLGRDLEDSPDKKRLTHSIIKGVRTINSIISNILLFTKEIQLEIKEHFLSDIVDDVILYLQHIMRDKEIRFINNISEESKIKCDAELFKQVVMNIIHNSVDAVKSGGEIRIESGADGTESWFTITDNGSGIEPSMTGKLFMPFQTTKAKGTGLGLAIVYKIIKAHGGNIEADSDGKTYTTFRVAVPA